MDQHLFSIYEHKIQRLVENLAKNNMKGVYLKDKGELLDYLNANLPDKSTVAVGGSQTLFELNLIEYLRARDVEFFDRYAEALTNEGRKEVFRKSFFADFYLTSSNAVTVDGHLYNVDGTGNRVAALTYGPDKVFVIIGMNKIVGSSEEAEARIREVAAPANCTRLNRNTPCTKAGSCMDCKVADRLCNSYSQIKRQGTKDRIEVLILPMDLGY